MSKTTKHRSAKRSSKLKKSADLTSKGWLLPDNTFVPLGSKWHHEWLQDNAPKLDKKFLTSFASRPVTPDDLQTALNRGFARVNYERNTGTLHIETGIGFFAKARRDAIFTLIADNLGDIDHVKLDALNPWSIVIQRHYARLFEHSDREKLNNLPFLD